MKATFWEEFCGIGMWAYCKELVDWLDQVLGRCDQAGCYLATRRAGLCHGTKLSCDCVYSLGRYIYLSFSTHLPPLRYFTNKINLLKYLLYGNTYKLPHIHMGNCQETRTPVTFFPLFSYYGHSLFYLSLHFPFTYYPIDPILLPPSCSSWPVL